jgi:hypothetical protein
VSGPAGLIDRQILGEQQFQVALEQQGSALRQAKPLGPVRDGVRSDDIEDSLVLFLADLPQVTVAGQDLTPGYRRRRRDGLSPRQQRREQSGRNEPR